MRRGALIVVLGLVGASACGTLVGSSDDGAPTTPISGADGSVVTDASASTDATEPARLDGAPDAIAKDAEATDTGVDAKATLDAGCGGAVSCERVIFVTSKTYAPIFNQLTTADGLCQGLADASTNARVKGRKFLAWLSKVGNAADDPESRMKHGTQNYVLPSGTVVAAGWTGLLGNHASAVNQDENGATVNGAGVWTATQNTATAVSPDCQGWSSLQGTDQAKVGSSSSTDGAWTDSNGLACDQKAHLYCVEY